jgi:hypothetical protein
MSNRWLWRRSFLVGILCISLVGCQVSTAPTQVSQFDGRHAVAMMRAPWNGEYALYLLPPDRKGPRKQIQTAHLQKNDPLGFRQRETGPVAVVGELEIPLNPGDYQWEMQADKGQIDWFTSSVLIAVTVIVVAGIIAIIVAVQVNHAVHHALDGINGI